MKQKLQRNITYYWLISHGLFSLYSLIYNSAPPVQEWFCPITSSAHPHLSSTKTHILKIAHSLAHKSIWWGHFLKWSSLFFPNDCRWPQVKMTASQYKWLCLFTSLKEKAAFSCYWNRYLVYEQVPFWSHLLRHYFYLKSDQTSF